MREEGEKPREEERERRGREREESGTRDAVQEISRDQNKYGGGILKQWEYSWQQ